jgi:hypothetical protein
MKILKNNQKTIHHKLWIYKSLNQLHRITCKWRNLKEEPDDPVQHETLELRKMKQQRRRSKKWQFRNGKWEPKPKSSLMISTSNPLKNSWSTLLINSECSREWLRKRTKSWKRLNSIDFIDLF